MADRPQSSRSVVGSAPAAVVATVVAVLAGVLVDAPGSPGVASANVLVADDGTRMYREIWVPHEQFTGSCDHEAGGEFYVEPAPACDKTLTVDIPFDPSSATRVEMVLDLWRNRDTPALSVSLNGNPPFTPDVGRDWSRTPWSSLDQLGDIGPLLVPGANTITLSASAASHVHDIVFRFHVDGPDQLVGDAGDDEPPGGTITSVGDVPPGGTIDLDALTDGILELRADATDTGAGVAYVEFLGFYDGFDEDNDGATRDWHVLHRNNWGPGGSTRVAGGGEKPTGPATHHLGSDATAPYRARWDTTIVTAPQDVWFRLRIVDRAGNVTETEPTGPYRLSRSASDVRWIRPASFDDEGLHMGGNRAQRTYVRYAVDAAVLEGVTGAWIVGNYWGNPQVALNGGRSRTAFGFGGDTTDRWDLSVLAVPVEDLVIGDNVASFSYNALDVAFGEFVEHPGPVLVLERRPGGPARIEAPPRDRTVPAGTPVRLRVIASGSGLSYRWEVDRGSGFDEVAGATGPGIDLGPVDPSMNGWRYRVRVTGGGTGVTSPAATLGVVPAPGTAPVGPWVYGSHEQRTLIAVHPGGLSRSGTWQAVSGFSVPPGSGLRAVEVDDRGEPLGEVGVELLDGDGDGVGVLLVETPGPTGPDALRRFHVYADVDGVPSSDPGDDRVVVVADELWGRPVHRLRTPAAEMVLDDRGGALAGLIDDLGNDWIAWAPEPVGSGGAFRGYPNAADDLFHPGADTATVTVTADGRHGALIDVSTLDGYWSYSLLVLEDRALFTLEDFADRRCAARGGPSSCAPGEGAAGRDFWWQYEGVPGGALGDEDLVVRPDPERDGGWRSSGQGSKWNEDLAGPEWAAVLDRDRDRALVHAQASDDSLADLYRRFASPGEDPMAVLAFGRAAAAGGSPATPLLPFRPDRVNEPVGGRWILALTDAATPSEVAARATALAREPHVVVGATGERPAGVDTEPPAITGVAAGIADGVITVSWRTDEPATALLEWGRSEPGEDRRSRDTLAVTHELSGPAGCGGTWAYRITSTDAAGNTATTAGSVTADACPAPTTTTTTTTPTTTTTTTTAPGPGAVPAGYWLVTASGTVHPFGEVRHHGGGRPGTADVTDIEASPTGRGYWIIDSAGRIGAFGDATHHGDLTGRALEPGERATAVSATPTGRGYWVFTDRGRIVAFGDAPDVRDLVERGLVLNGPLIDAVATPDGRGVLAVAADGGVFAFGTARFAGSMGGRFLARPVVGVVSDPDGRGYWLVAADGGVFAFDAPFVGSVPGALPEGTRLVAPVVGMVASGAGYLIVAADGGVFAFRTTFRGSLGGSDLPSPVVALAATT